MSDPDVIDMRAHKVKQQGKRLAETSWSDLRGEVMLDVGNEHGQQRRKWLGLTIKDWGFFAGVSAAGFLVAMMVLGVAG